MKRREALHKIIVGTGTVIFIPASILSCSEEPAVGGYGSGGGGNGGGGGGNLEIDLTVTANSALLTEGGFMLMEGIIVVNTGGDEWVALSSTCTHQGCTVSYNESGKNFPCPCHGSLFSSTGSVLRGPASRPLTKYDITKKGSLLTVITG